MAEYHMVVLTKAAHGWELMTTSEESFRAQANPGGLRQDMSDKCTDYFSDNETMDDGMIARAASIITNEIEDIDAEEAILLDVRSTLRRLLDEDLVDIESLDISEFIDVNIEVDERALVSEIESNKEGMDISFTVVLDAVGVIVYEVHDPDDVLVGKIVLNWLRD